MSDWSSLHDDPVRDLADAFAKLCPCEPDPRLAPDHFDAVWWWLMARHGKLRAPRGLFYVQRFASNVARENMPDRVSRVTLHGKLG